MAIPTAEPFTSFPGTQASRGLGGRRQKLRTLLPREVVGTPGHVSGSVWAQRDRSAGGIGPETYVCKKSRGGILCASCHSQMFVLDALCWPR